MGHDGKPDGFQRIGDSLPIQGKHIVIGNDANTAALFVIQGLQLFADRGQQSRTDFNLIPIGGRNRNRRHQPSTSSLRCLP